MFSIADLPANMQTKVTISGDCWEWTGARNPKGYGSVTNGKGGSMLAHRRAYEEVVGEIPDGLTIDHTCENTSCVNPAHLEPVTLAENIRRRYAGMTHCNQGHELSGSNLRLSMKKDGSERRVCVTCQRDYVRAYRARAKAVA